MVRAGRMAVVFVLGVVAAAAVHTAWGQIGPDGVITACRFHDNGGLRIPYAGDACNPNVEDTVTWNQTGPVGPAGPKGDPGAKGDAGAQGATGPGKALPAQGPPPAIRRISPSERKAAANALNYRQAGQVARAVPVGGPSGLRIMTAQLGPSQDRGLGPELLPLLGPSGPDTALEAKGIRTSNGTETAVVFPKPVIGCTVSATSSSLQDWVWIHSVGTDDRRNLYPSRRWPYMVNIGSYRSEPGLMHLIVICDPRNRLPVATQVAVQPLPVATPVPPGTR